MATRVTAFLGLIFILSVVVAQTMTTETRGTSRTTAVIGNSTSLAEFFWNVQGPNTMGFTTTDGTYSPWTCASTHTFYTVVFNSTLTRAACGGDIPTLVPNFPTDCSSSYVLRADGESKSCPSPSSCGSVTIKDTISASSPPLFNINCEGAKQVYRNNPLAPKTSSIAPTTSWKTTSTTLSTSRTSQSTPTSTSKTSGGDHLSRESITSIGVGIGVGVPAVLVAILAWIYPCRPAFSRRQRESRALKRSNAIARRQSTVLIG